MKIKNLSVAFISIFILISTKQTFSQKPRRFSNHTAIQYYFGLADSDNQKKSGMTTIKTSFNYKINPKYGLGLGLGLGNYNARNYNLFTAFLDSRYFFQNKLEGAEIYFNPGYAFKIDPTWREGFFLGLGASYPFSRRKHSNWNLNLNYRYQEVNSFNPEFGPTKMHGLGFGVGITFN